MCIRDRTWVAVSLGGTTAFEQEVGAPIDLQEVDGVVVVATQTQCGQAFGQIADVEGRAACCRVFADTVIADGGDDVRLHAGGFEAISIAWRSHRAAIGQLNVDADIAARDDVTLDLLHVLEVGEHERIEVAGQAGEVDSVGVGFGGSPIWRTTVGQSRVRSIDRIAAQINRVIEGDVGTTDNFQRGDFTDDSG